MQQKQKRRSVAFSASDRPAGNDYCQSCQSRTTSSNCAKFRFGCRQCPRPNAGCKCLVMYNVHFLTKRPNYQTCTYWLPLAICGPTRWPYLLVAHFLLSFVCPVGSTRLCFTLICCVAFSILLWVLLARFVALHLLRYVCQCILNQCYSVYSTLSVSNILHYELWL